MKTIELKEWEKIGEGGQGTVYKNIKDPELMLKLSKTTRQDIMQREYELSAYAGDLGLPTPKVYDFVTDGKHYGYTGQLIRGKKSLCRIIADDPARMPEMVQLFTWHVRRLHSIKADTTRLASRLNDNISDLRKIRFLKPETLEYIIGLYSSIPETQTLVHGDLHFGNLITTGREQYWIDLGQMHYGNPILDISQFNFVFTYLSVVCKPIFHVTAAQTRQFYDAFVEDYYGLSKSDENRHVYEDLLFKGTFAQLVGILKNGPLAIWFIPKLQQHMGLKPYSRWRILWMLMRGQKQIF